MSSTLNVGGFVRAPSVPAVVLAFLSSPPAEAAAPPLFLSAELLTVMCTFQS